MPQMDMLETPEEARVRTLTRVGDLSEYQVFHNEVLVAIYMRPDKTAGGILLPESTRDEDRYQGKAGLVVKMGSDAFHDDTGRWTWGGNPPKIGDWVWFRASDGTALTLNGRDGLCRQLEDVRIRGSLPRPDMIW